MIPPRFAERTKSRPHLVTCNPEMQVSIQRL